MRLTEQGFPMSLYASSKDREKAIFEYIAKLESRIAELEQQLAQEREARIRYENKLFAIGAMSEPPCFVCGYNGEGYFNAQKHSCAERHHRNQSTKQAHSAGDL